MCILHRQHTTTRRYLYVVLTTPNVLKKIASKFRFGSDRSRSGALTHRGSVPTVGAGAEALIADEVDDHHGAVAHARARAGGVAVEDGAVRIALQGRCRPAWRWRGLPPASPPLIAAGAAARGAGIPAGIAARRAALHADRAGLLADGAGDGEVAGRGLRAGAGLAVMVVAAGGWWRRPCAARCWRRRCRGSCRS